MPQNSPALNIFHIVLVLYIFIYLQIWIFNANPMVLFSLQSSENWQYYSMNTIKQPALKHNFDILLILYIFIYVRIRIFNANPMVLFSLKSSENWRSYSMITINQEYPAGFGSSKNGNYINLQHYPLPSTHSCLPPTYITRCIVTYIL
jgi:hypothetical protein